MFTLIAGKSMATYIRARWLDKACRLIAGTELPLTEIALACGFSSSPAFSRAFKREYGMPPNAFRLRGCVPVVHSVDEIIRRFTNRIQGGVYVNPTMMKRETLRIAGCSGPGDRTGEVWMAYEALEKKGAPQNRIDENGYEVRVYLDGIGTVYVGCAVRGGDVPEGYEVIELPASEYASFDVYVAQGYESENNAMKTWLGENSHRYAERKLGSATYVVEYYDERFQGTQSGSIVEIWIPVERVRANESPL